MTKFNLLICSIFVIFHYGNSLPELPNFGSFFGGCPEVKSVSNTLFEDGKGDQWYTHRVLGSYSPWKYLRCISSEFNFNNYEASTVSTKFALPYLPVSFQMQGNVEAVNRGEYALSYESEVFGNVPQKIAVLSTFNMGQGAVIWTCSDYKYFHLESVQLITKNKVPSMQNQNYNMIEIGLSAIRRYGLTPEAAVTIDQSC